MSTLVKIIITSILSLSLFSCNFDFNMGVKGNGNVITKARNLEGSFDQIEASHGLDVYLTQSDIESVEVQADENLHDIIITKVESNTLKIYVEGNISYSKGKKVMVSFKDVSNISSASGSDVYGTNIVTANNLELITSSGSDMTLDVKVARLNCTTSSGSDLKLTGTADTLIAKATSGSDIDAKNLKTLIATAKALSGADVKVNVLKELTANADSGGDITYTGAPEKVTKSKGVSASIKMKN